MTVAGTIGELRRSVPHDAIVLSKRQTLRSESGRNGSVERDLANTCSALRDEIACHFWQTDGTLLQTVISAALVVA